MVIESLRKAVDWVRKYYAPVDETPPYRSGITNFNITVPAYSTHAGELFPLGREVKAISRQRADLNEKLKKIRAREGQ